MLIIKIVLILILLLVIIPFLGRIVRNEQFLSNGIKTFGTVTNSYPTGVFLKGIPQQHITLSYVIDGVSYTGCAVLFVERIFYLGMVIPIRVNPKNLVDCSIIMTRIT